MDHLEKDFIIKDSIGITNYRTIPNNLINDVLPFLKIVSNSNKIERLLKSSEEKRAY